MTTTPLTTPRTQRPLIAGVLRGPRVAPITKDLCPDGFATAAAAAVRRPAPVGFSPAECAAARHAAADGRDAGERTIDYVVDRLLRELSW
jgi:hypothetical protein